MNCEIVNGEIQVMKSRERVEMALNHEEPDRVPRWNWIAPVVSRQLREILGIPHEDPKQLNIELGEDLIMGFLGIPSPWVTQVVDPNAVPENNMIFEDAWGIKYKGVWQKNGGSYPMIISHPLADVKDLSRYSFQSVEKHVDLEPFKNVVKEYKKDFSIVGAVLSTIFEGSWFLRGFEKFMQDLLIAPDFAEELMDNLMKFSMKNALKAVELGADIVMFGDDFGMETNMMISPELWRKYFKPRYAKMFQELKKAKKNIYIAFHTDGYIEPIIPDFVEIGLDILNPLQPSCHDLTLIKKKYGKHLTFWGAIDIQHVIPFGSTKEVIDEVRTRVRQLAPGGGFIIDANGIEPSDRVIDNIFAYQWALDKYANYPLRGNSIDII